MIVITFIGKVLPKVEFYPHVFPYLYDILSFAGYKIYFEAVLASIVWTNKHLGSLILKKKKYEK